MKLAPRGAMHVGSECVLRPVVGLDIDGTLANWHEDFLQFAWRWLHGRAKKPPESWFMLHDGRSMSRHMSIPHRVYREVKLAYRQSGLKRDLMPFPGARELVQQVRSAGAEVWVCTTRPYLRLDNIDPDTREWLERNGITADGVIFGEEKYRDLVELVGVDRIVGILEDLPDMAMEASQYGLNVSLIQRNHNREWWQGGEGRLPTLPHLPAAQEWLLAEIQKWKANHDVG